MEVVSLAGNSQLHDTIEGVCFGREFTAATHNGTCLFHWEVTATTYNGTWFALVKIFQLHHTMDCFAGNLQLLHAMEQVPSVEHLQLQHTELRFRFPNYV